MMQSVYVILSHHSVQLFDIKIRIVLTPSFICVHTTSAIECPLHNLADVLLVLLLLVVPKLLHLAQQQHMLRH